MVDQDLQSAPKKPRLVFTDLQRRTLQAIFKVTESCNKISSLSSLSLCHSLVDWNSPGPRRGLRFTICCCLIGLSNILRTQI